MALRTKNPAYLRTVPAELALRHCAQRVRANLANNALTSEKSSLKKFLTEMVKKTSILREPFTKKDEDATRLISFTLASFIFGSEDVI